MAITGHRAHVGTAAGPPSRLHRRAVATEVFSTLSSVASAVDRIRSGSRLGSWRSPQGQLGGRVARSEPVVPSVTISTVHSGRRGANLTVIGKYFPLRSAAPPVPRDPRGRSRMKTWLIT